MIAKQDRVQARTPAQLEQEYNLGRAIKSADNSNLVIQLQQLNQTLSQFMVDTKTELGKLDEANQTWFYSGIPTLTNQPASQWIADGTASKHIGDIYCNEDDGSIYLFKGENDIYSWIKCFQGTPEKENYNVIFYNENNIVILGYTIAQGDAINPPPVANAKWIDSNGNEVSFPYTPTSDTKLYISNEGSTL